MSKNSNDDEYFFKYSATLRIMGEISNLTQITTTLGLEPTHTHKKGEPGPLRRPYEYDMWCYAAPVPRAEPLDAHLQKLWSLIQPHKAYLLELKKTLKVDIFCGYQSDSGTAGFEVSHKNLEIFTELEVPFDVSVIVSSAEIHEAHSWAEAQSKRRNKHKKR